jgi:arylsulfatase A-like enzyme
MTGTIQENRVEGPSVPAAPAPALSIGVVAEVMIWSALVSGFLQVAGVLVTKHVAGEILGMGPHLLWMIPLANLLLFLIPGILLILVTRRMDGVTSRSLVVWLFAFLGFLNLTLSVPRLAQWTSILLALGLAAVSVRFLAARWNGFARTVRLTWPLFAAAVLLLFVGVSGYERIREGRAVGALPPAPDGRPNILLLVLDTVRSINLSIQGYARPTSPALEKLSAEGVLFENAMATSSWTLPSHGGMFTGRYAYELTADWEVPLDEEYRTLAEELKQQGYLTGGFAANAAYVNRNYGLNQGFDHFRDFDISLGEILVSSKLGRDLTSARWFRRISGYHDFLGRKSAADVVEEFLGWVGRDSTRPFFGFLNFFDAHEPYLPPEPYAAAFASSNTVRNNLEMLHLQHRAERLHKTDMTAAEVQREVDAYDAGIAYIDAQIDRMVRALAARGLLENTIVIVTSDHGEHFGEHGFFEHGNTLYQPVIHVPLVILGPGVPKDRRIETPVSLRDLPVTSLDLAGLGQSGFPGRSLRSTWEGAPADARLFASLRTVGGAELVSIREGDHYLVKRPNKKPMLFDLSTDPGETRDLINEPALQPLVASLGASIDSALLQARKPHDR